MLVKKIGCNEQDQSSFENRQRALEVLQETSEHHGIYAACGTSAGLYLSILAARSLGYGQDDFLCFAPEV